MDMFGGLTKTSSRIAIAAAFGLMLGGFAFKATPAQAADLGGDCCADLEERVAELEATTVRKGNKKVSVTLSGWVVKTMNFWDDGDIDSFFVGDKGYDLGSRFAITGSATIAPGWSAGFNLTILATSDLFATSGTLANSNQFFESGNTFFDHDLNPLYSYIYIKSDTLGTLNWGHLSPASDNPAVLADLSGTVIESNGVWFEGASFFLRAKGNPGGFAGLTSIQWEDALFCQGLGLGIGLDCFGAAMPAVRYDSPTWGGFRFETSYGTNTLTPGGTPGGISTTESNFWDIAVFYTADWNSIKLSAAAAYNTWQETDLAGDWFPHRRTQRQRGGPVPGRRQHHAQAVRPRYLRHVPDRGEQRIANDRHRSICGFFHHRHPQQPRNRCLVREALLAEGLEPDRRHGAVRRVWSV